MNEKLKPWRYEFFFIVPQWARKFKKGQAKKVGKSDKSISIFCNFKNGQKSIFELGKSLKLPEMQFQEKIFIIYLISRVFCLDFFKCSGPLWTSPLPNNAA